MNPIINFDLDCFLKAANELLRSDETIRALNLLDNLPAYYRQNIPQEVINLKREVMSRIATAAFYANSSGYELTAPDDSHTHVKNTLRGHLLLREIKAFNERDITPHVLDLAPGEYAFVRMLLHEQCIFTYEPSFVNHPSFNHYKKHFEEYMQEGRGPGQPAVYFAGEIIEHLWQEEELRYEMERRVGPADVVHISTPHMTFDFNCTDWKSKGDLGHLRTYTAQEFASTIHRIFPDYHCQVLVSPILHARCVWRSAPDYISREVSV